MNLSEPFFQIIFSLKECSFQYSNSTFLSYEKNEYGKKLISSSPHCHKISILPPNFKMEKSNEKCQVHHFFSEKIVFQEFCFFAQFCSNWPKIFAISCQWTSPWGLLVKFWFSILLLRNVVSKNANIWSSSKWILRKIPKFYQEASLNWVQKQNSRKLLF